MSDFNWDDYLEETGALSVPHHAFKHVGSRFQVQAWQSVWLHLIHLTPHVCAQSDSVTKDLRELSRPVRRQGNEVPPHPGTKASECKTSC